MGPITFHKANWSDYQFLYSLLEERMSESYINISHTVIPTYKDHVQFCESNPYQMWFVINAGNEKVGAVYLTKRNEIGVHIIKSHRHQRIGQAAVEYIEGLVPSGTKILANINPRNEKSLHFFERNGYRILQVTYSKEIKR